jgi:DNA-binding transcriptional regulator YiaG
MISPDMSPDELKAARASLGLTQAKLAAAIGIVSSRTVSGWEMGMRNGRANAIPGPAAVLVRLALNYAQVRRELGIKAEK